MGGNKTLFSNLFAIAVVCLIFPIHVSADLYGEGAYGSEKYSGNNSTTTAPNAPTSIVATAGNGQASISFVPPANNGGAMITSYVVTASPGGATAAGLTSPIIITGLSNGTPYTFTMTAINSVGTSSLSTVSNIITPVTPPSSPGPSYGGGGSTSGTSYIPTTAVNTPVINLPVTPPVVDEVVSQTTQNIQNTVSNFSNNITVGAIQAEVKSLQQFLNKQGFIISKSGAGAIGKETNKFGAATKAALIKFQKANGIPATGFFGPLTRAAVNSILGKNSENNSTTTAAVVNTTVYTRDLDLNMLGEDVKALQQFLNKNGFIIAQTGPGSLGNETNKFGGATKAALIKFQKANDLSPAIGYFGPLTRALVISLTK